MTVVAQMLLSDPSPLIIWAILLLSATLAFVALANPQVLRTLGPVFAVAGERRARRAHRRNEAADAMRYADELIVVTQRAAQAADQWHKHWQEAEQQVATTWQDWQDAEDRLTRSRAAGAFQMPAARTPDEYADRERFLHRTVRLAVDRGDLPAAALTDAHAGRSGWNPWLHPVDQELAIHRAIAAHRHNLHQQATVAEEAARHDARLALSSRDRLHQEAAAAATQAAAVRHLVPLAKARAATRTRVVVPQIA